MSAVPPPSGRVLADLDVPALVRAIVPNATPLARAWADLARAHAEHVTALSDLDRIEAGLIDAQGYPRVALPTAGDAPPAYAADITKIARHLGRSPLALRLTAALRRRQRRFARAAAAAGREQARARVQRHPELPPLRQQELTPMLIALLRRLRVEASQRPFAKGRCDAFREAGSCRPGS